MWLFTTLGFFSITRSRLQPDRFQIRARDEKHVRALAAHMDLEMLTPGFLGPILESPTADYRWRCMVNEARCMATISEQAHLVTYSNVKAAAATANPADRRYLNALHDVWARMLRLQASAKSNPNQEPTHG